MAHPNERFVWDLLEKGQFHRHVKFFALPLREDYTNCKNFKWCLRLKMLGFSRKALCFCTSTLCCFKHIAFAKNFKMFSL